MKRKVIGLFLTAAMTAALVGCGGGANSGASASTAAADTTQADTAEATDTASAAASDAAGASSMPAADELSGTVTTDGSTSMESVIGLLSESFHELYPDVEVTYNPTGSGSGIQAVSEGRCDFGLASRDLKDDEKSQGLTQTVVAIDGIAMVVSPENKVENLTLDQISKIYTGEITNWSEVGGADGEIVPIGREAGSGTRDGFESITDTKDKCKYSQELTSTGDVIQTVAGNPNAIGYASLAALNDTVKAVSVDDVAPSEETVQDGSYKIQRNFVIVTKDGTELSKEAQTFFDYATSTDVDELIKKAGAVPVVR